MQGKRDWNSLLLFARGQKIEKRELLYAEGGFRPRAKGQLQEKLVFFIFIFSIFLLQSQNLFCCTYFVVLPTDLQSLMGIGIKLKIPRKFLLKFGTNFHFNLNFIYFLIFVKLQANTIDSVQPEWPSSPALSS